VTADVLEPAAATPAQRVAADVADQGANPFAPAGEIA